MTRVFALLLAAFLAACGTSDAPAGDGGEDDGFRVVATTTILGDLLADLVVDHGTVEVLVGAGQDPHALALSARQVQSVQEADLVVAVGLGLEASLDDVLAQARQDGVEVVELGPLLDPLEAGESGAHDPDHDDEAHDDEAHDDEDHDDDGDEHGELDPHVWLDPVRMADGVRLLAERVAEVAAGRPGADEVDWEARGDALAVEVLAAHDDAVDLLAEVPERCRVLVTNHDAFGYFADRYGFEVIGTVIPGTSTQARPSARDFADLAELVRTRGVPAVFAETTQSVRLAESLAEEVGREVAIVTLFSGSLGPPGSGAERYVDLVRENARLVADALGPCP